MPVRDITSDSLRKRSFCDGSNICILSVNVRVDTNIFNWIQVFTLKMVEGKFPSKISDIFLC